MSEQAHAEPVPICRNCAHHSSRRSFIEQADHCTHPAVAGEIDVVTGLRKARPCHVVRGQGSCGQAGDLFTPSANYLRDQHCTNKVRARRPYASRIELVPLCEVEDLRDKSDSTNRSNASACSGCAFSPNSR